MPELNMKIKEWEKLKFHYGNCDLCNEKRILVCDFGYYQQPKNFRICRNCLEEVLKQFNLYISEVKEDV